MAESNPIQVILTDDGIKIINAQNTANNAAGGVANLNDPNLMSVIEKQTQAAQYAGLTSQYNVILAQAKEANISTTALTTAYTRLNTFMTAILTDTTKASDVDRDTYKGLISDYNTVLSNVQTALSNSFNTDISNMQSSVSVASQAASSAVIVASQATVTGNNASQVASQALTTASQAQIAGNNATSVANNASQAASNAILAGSTATVKADKAINAASQAQIAGDNATSIANNAIQAASSAVIAGSTATVTANKASADYQTLSAGVNDGSVVHITTETVIDKGVIGTAEIANGAITNAQIGSEAVDSAQIADLAVGTAQIGDGAITNAKIGSLAVGTAQIANGAITNAQIGSLAVDTVNIKDAAITNAKIANLAVGTAQLEDAAITRAKIGDLAVGTAQIEDAAITDAKVGDLSANHLNAGTIDFSTITGKNINASNITTGTLSTDRLNVGKLSALSANLGDVTTGSLKGVDIIANTFSTPNGSFTTDSNGNVVASNLTIRGVTNLVYNAALLGGNGSYIPGWGISNNGYYSNQVLHDGVPSIGYHNSTGAGVWVNFAQSKLYSLNGKTGLPYSASVWFLEVGSDTNLKYQFTLAFFDANGNRLDSGYVGNTWNGIGSRQDWRYVTINNAVSPSTAVYVAIQYWAYNGSGYGLFSSPMLTQTAQSTGYQPDTGNIVSAGEIDGSVINGSTINGTTFNAGSKLNQYGNTSYPLTISSDGSVTSTSIGNIANDPATLRTVVGGGMVKTNFRGMNQISTGIYPAADVALGAGQLALLEGYSTSQDPNFTATGMKTTGYVILDASTGLSLHGSTQAINFSGTDQSQTTGITMNSYGNVYGQTNSAWWRIGDVNGNQIVNFGIDSAGSNDTQFKRDIWVGNMGIGSGHQVRSNDGKGIYFTDNNSNRVDTYHNNIYYSGSVSKSLLSEKTNVKVADVNYWSNLAMSINLATYNYNTDDYTDPLRLSGIIDDVNKTKEWTLPEAFYARDENSNIVGIDNGVLLNAVLALSQEQAKQIDKLSGHNMELEVRLNKLEAKING